MRSNIGDPCVRPESIGNSGRENRAFRFLHVARLVVC